MRNILTLLLVLLSAASITLTAAAPAGALTPQQRKALDLQAYTVSNPSAGYFDLPARRAEVKASTSPAIRKQVKSLSSGVSCSDALAIPVITGNLSIPLKNQDPAAWRRNAAPFFAFEDAVSHLAGAQFVASNGYHGECLIKLLNNWAQQRAFLELSFTGGSGLQTWFQTEASIFSAAMAYAVVRDDVKGMDAEKAAIEQWLVLAAQHHLARHGGVDGSCCNNHFYRRAVYATMLGVLTKDDQLFRTGISAVYSAISDADAQGALPLEMKRGKRAAHYQNYATMYLLLIAQIAKQQGYDLYGVTIDGKTLGTIAGFSLDMLQNPDIVSGRAGGAEQDREFVTSPQYLAWLDLLPPELAGRADVKARLAGMKPRYNRSLGGYTTLYFGAK